MLFPLPLRAQTVTWGGSSGNWNVPANWTSGTAPGSGTNAIIDSGTALLPVSVTGTANALTIGNSGTGALTISGGSLGDASVVMGSAAGSNGTATVGSGTWATSGSFIVGNSGTGTLNVGAGGVVAASGTVILGNGVGSVGNVTLTSGILNGSIIVGNSGTGILTLSSGSVGGGSSGTIVLGYLAGSSGTVIMTGGTFGAFGTTVGNKGIGSFTVNGGLVSGAVSEANQAGSSGTFIFNGGTWNNASAAVGQGGAGAISINGGLVNVGSGFLIGTEGTGTGSITVTGGTMAFLNANTLTIGGSNASTGSGTFLIKGGLVTSDGVSFNSDASGNGTGAISGGTWQDSGTLSGTANLNISGGAVSTVATTINGTISMSGGSWTNSGTFSLNKNTGGGVLNLSGGATLIIGTTTGKLVLGPGDILNIGTGGTTGTLSAATISGSGATVINFNQTGTAFFNPAIVQVSGSAQVNNIAGTAILSGTSFAGIGGISISSGTLQFGNGGVEIAPAVFTISDNGVLAFGASGTTTLQNSITGTGGILQAGTGVTVLTGTNNSFSGPTTVNQGTLTLDFSQLTGRSSNLINNTANNSALVLGGGTLSIIGSSGSSNSQQFNGTTLNAGASSIAMNQNGASSLSLSLGAVTRNVGSTLDIILPAAGAVSTASGTDAFGLLGAGITVNGSDWATVSGGNIVAFSGYTISNNAATWTAGQNISNSSGTPNAYTGTVGSNLTIGSLKFDNASSGTVGIASGNVLTVSDGILVTSAVGGNSSGITGGTLQGAAGADLVVINNNLSGVMTIGSTITDNGGPTALTKSGAGEFALNGSSNYTGTTYLNAGTLDINGVSSIGAGQLIINGGNLDNTSGNSVTFGNSQLWNSDFTFVGTNNLAGSGTMTLAGPGIARTVTVSTGTLSAASITGSGYGIIKSGPGTLDLTGSSNYGGDMVVAAGTLLVSAGASLNHGGSTDTIGSGSTDNGLLLLNGGNITDLNLLIASGFRSRAMATMNSGMWASGTLTVGGLGSGTLNLNGGTLTDSTSSIGLNQGQTAR